MTNQEKIVVSAYTGVLMCDFGDVHKYIEEKLGRPVYTHEMAQKALWDEIKEKSKDDFMTICKGESHWIPCSERLPDDGEVVLTQANFRYHAKMAVSSRVDYNYWTGWGTRDINVVAWQPLPEPYKEDKDGN